MARFELPEESRKRVDEIGSAELVIGIAGTAPLEQLIDTIPSWLQKLEPAPQRTVLAFPAMQEMPESQSLAGGLELLPLPSAYLDAASGHWAEASAAQIAAIEVASALGAKACAVFHPDLAALDDVASLALVTSVLDGSCDLVMPSYPEGKYEGLITKGLLAPLSRALSGRRVRSPLPNDFCVSGRMLPKLIASQAPRSQAGPYLLWPATAIGVEGGQVCEAPLNIHHARHSEGLELSTVLAQLVGSLFQETELTAAQWQRVRGSQFMRSLKETTREVAHESDGDAPDPQPLIDSFKLGFRNLEEVWRIALPPISVFELQRLSRMSPEEFSMPDQLWARVVYDFAVAWHVRRIGRNHLMGAMTPLYLGWVASYMRSVSHLSAGEAEMRLDQLSQAFETNKPYFVSRWRWPDRVS